MAYGLVKEVDNLRKTTFDTISDGMRPMSMDFILPGSGFVSFKSRHEVTKKVMDMLNDSKVRIIGVYGLGGVGKTTFVKKVARKAINDKLFDMVVFAHVTSTPDIKKIQSELADQLGVRFDKDSEIGRASRLQDIFNNEKKNTLVILDDLWVRLDLNKLGIPVDGANPSSKSVEGIYNFKMSKDEVTNDSKRFKILLTSRDREVLSGKMELKDNSIFSLKGLQDEEAEILFKKVTRVNEKSHDFQQLAITISKKCGGLPITIITVGRTLRTKNYIEWKDALGQLERKNFIGVDESLHFSTKLSFYYLENEDLKSTFLLCAQLGHHPLIMELVKYCIGLGIFKGFLSIRKTREKILTLIKRLKDSSLLVNSYSNDYFNMHDVICDAALSIAYEDQHILTMRNEKLSEWPHSNEFEMYNAISIHNCDTHDELPNFVSCPKLKMFHIDSLDPSFRLPDNFFNTMGILKALILTCVDLSNSLTLISCLTNLRMLCLEQCMLGDISFIGEMKKLRILSLSRSNIQSLPATIGQLCKLQLLDISNCIELREIPPNVLSGLTNLEELYMTNSVKWKSEGNRSGNAILAELRYLHQLKSLDICILDAASLPWNLFLNNLDSYKIVIGNFKTLSVGDFNMSNKDENSRALALQIKERNHIHTHKAIKLLFKKVEKLLLGEVEGVQNIFYELNLEGFLCLKQLSIINNSDIKWIIDSMELLDPEDPFPNLESLCLYKLGSLEKITNSKLTATSTSFSNLKIVRIKSCGQLKSIFSLSMVLLLKNLETIEVSDCESVENIVAKDVEIGSIQWFPELRSLMLQNLPKFSGFYSNDRGGSSAEICFFNEEVAVPKLESLELSWINMHKIWSEESKPFEKLMKLKVQNCKEIKYLLSISVAKDLGNLKSLSISDCEKMERIFESELATVREHSKLDLVRVFPKLEEIQLSDMENLTSIWPKEVTQDSFSSLNSVSIEHCHKIVPVLPSHMVGKFGGLKSLKIGQCDLLEEIFDLKDPPHISGEAKTHLQVLEIEELSQLKHVWNKDPVGILNFNRLEKIKVLSCGNLEYLFPLSVATRAQELVSLSLTLCFNMEEVARKERLADEISQEEIAFEFPKLTTLRMQLLPKLKSFYKGRHCVKWPKLKKLGVLFCSMLEVFHIRTTSSEEATIFLPKEVLPNLETMFITLKEAEMLKLCIKNYRMSCLKKFTLLRCPPVETLHCFLSRMPYLEELTLLADDKLREVIPSGSHMTQENIGNVAPLKSLKLSGLSDLKEVGFERDPVLQWLENLSIKECGKLVNLAPPSVTLAHLTSLKVRKCRGLENMMGFSIAKSLAQLTSFKVVECTMLEKIVAEQNGEDKITSRQEIVFSKLKTLELVDLPALCCFCNFEMHAFKFPSLEKLIVRDCSNMTKFSVQVTTPINLQVLKSKEEEENWYWKGDLNATILQMFLHSLQSLELSNYAELEEIWLGKISPANNSFQKLTTLVVKNCEFLSTVIPSYLLPYLENLEELHVERCGSVEVIFDGSDMVMKKSHLKRLILCQLPKMKHVWNKNLEGILSYENLEVVAVTKCQCLYVLFPAVPLAKNLSKLETLKIIHCGALVDIVGNADEIYEARAIEQFLIKKRAIEQFEFPCLRTLSLGNLPELKHFYPGRMILRCPKLEVLDTYQCGKLQIFASEKQSNHRSTIEDQIGPSINPQTLFSAQEVISRLKHISVNKEEAMMLCTEDIQAHLVSKLEVLQLYCFDNVNGEDGLPFKMLHKLPITKSLVVAYSDLCEIFPTTLKSGIGSPRFSELRLEFLPKLKCIGLEHPYMNSLGQKLQYLRIERCPSLTKLVQSAVYLPKLRELEITKCHGLEYLFTTQTANSLMKLKELRVCSCESIKMIVAQEEGHVIDDIDNEIEFGKLRRVAIHSLPSLQCFYKGTSTLEFPYLDYLNIEGCPNMKYFSQECIYAPSMRKTNIPPLVKNDDWTWEINFSTSLRQLFTKKAETDHRDTIEVAAAE